MGVIREKEVATLDAEIQKDVIQGELPKTNPVMVFKTETWTQKQIECAIKAASETGHTVEKSGLSIILFGQGDRMQLFSRMSKLLNGDGQ